MKVDGPDLMKEEMDGWDEKKGGYVCVCVTGGRKKGRRRDWAELPNQRRGRASGELQERRSDKWGEDRGLPDQSEQGKEGKERREGIGRIPVLPARPGRHSPSFSDDFTPFSGKLNQTNTPYPHIDLPSSCLTPKIMKNRGGFVKPAHVGARLLVRNSSIF